MKLRQHLVMSQGLIMLLTLLVFPLAVWGIGELATRTSSVATDDMRAIAAAERIREEVGSEAAGLLRRAISGGVLAEGADVQPEFPARAAIEEARRYFTLPAERAALGELEEQYTHLRNSIAIWQAGQMTPAAAAALSGSFDDVRLAAIRLHRLKLDALYERTRSARAFAHDMLIVVISLGGLALLLGLAATRQVVRSILTPIDRFAGQTRRIAGGDFDIVAQEEPIDEFNQLERHFESMSHALRAFRESDLERLLVEQRRIDAVLDSIGDGLVIFSDVGRIERINAVAERQLGLEPGTSIGRTYGEICDAAVAERVGEILAAGENGAVDPEIGIERGGEMRVLSFGIHRFVETGGHRPGVVMVLRDVTAQREFDRMRSEFVMRASHELRTPITGIRMGLGLLGEKLQFAPGSRDEELFRTVQQELGRMVTLLGDLLDLSRLRAGGAALDLLPASIEEVLGGARARFAFAASEKSVELDTDIERGLPPVMLCRSAFDRVLDNLITNALRYTPDNGSITLSAHRATDRLLVAVADSGEGIPSAHQAVVFEPFVQVGKSRGGVGLGLAICKEIVQQHGGQIRVSSLPRRGATFTISLPA